LDIIRAAGVEPAIQLYLEDTPSAVQIAAMANKLGLTVADLLRRGESEFKEATDLPNLDDDMALAEWLQSHPIVLERPIVVDSSSGRAVVGRPPENVNELLS